MEDNPLNQLVVDGAEFDRQRMAEALRGRLALDESTSTVIVLPEFARLSSTQKVLALMLLRKAAVLLNRAPLEGQTPKTLSDQSGVPGGTTRRVLRELLESHGVSQDAGGLYSLSSPQVGLAIETLNTPAEEERTRSDARPGRQRTGRGKRPSGDRAATSDQSTDPAHTKQSSVRSQTRSPTSLVRGLKEDGFFDGPKSLADAQRRLKDKTGYQIPVTTLSSVFTRMLRAGEFDRELTNDGLYTYTRRKS